MLKMATFKTSKWMGVQRDLDINSKAEISDLMNSKKPPDYNIKRIPISSRKDLKIKLTYRKVASRSTSRLVTPHVTN